MKNGVTKKQLVKSFAETLKLTRAEVSDLELVDNDTVCIHYECGGTRMVNIAADSGCAMMRDILKVID